MLAIKPRGFRLLTNFRTFEFPAQHPDGVMSTPAAPVKINTTYNRSIFTAHAAAQSQAFGSEQEAPAPGASVLQPAASAWTSMAGKQDKPTPSAPSHTSAPAPAAAPAAAPTGWAAVAARGASAQAAAPVPRPAPASAAVAPAAPVEQAPVQPQAPVPAPAPVPVPVAAPAPAAAAGSWAAVAGGK